MSLMNEQNWLETWGELVGKATSFRQSCLLIAALELDVFRAVDDSEVPSLASIAVRINVNEKNTHTLLNALISKDLLVEDSGYYSLHERHRSFLVEAPLNAIADLSRYREENEAWLRISQILREEEAVSSDYVNELLNGKAANYPALKEFNRIHSKSLIQLLDNVINQPFNVLDMGGGDGVISAQLLAQYPDSEVTILELENGAEPALNDLSSEFDSGRLHVVYGDARQFSSTSRYDLVILNELLELFDATQKRLVVRRGLQALEPDGHIVFIKFSMDESGLTPSFSAMFSMRMLLKFGSYLETDSELIQLLESEGAQNIKVMKLGPLKTVVTANKIM